MYVFKNNLKIPIQSTGQNLENIKSLSLNQKEPEWKKAFLEKSLLKLSQKNKNEKISIMATILKNLADDDSLPSSLLKAYFYLHIKNMGKVNEYLDRIYRSEPLTHFIELDSSNFNNSEKKEIQEKFFEILNFIIDELDEPTYYNMLKIVVARFFEFNGRKEFAEKFDVDYSLQEIRNIIKSPNKGLRYPSVWFPLLYQRVNFAEAIEYLELSLNFLNLDEMLGEIMWLFQVYLPRDEKIREKIISKLIEFEKSSSIKHRELYFRLQENEKIRSILIKRGHTKPIFTQQRQFYRNLINNGHAVYYSLYRLLKLGDNQDAYFLWITI